MGSILSLGRLIRPGASVSHSNASSAAASPVVTTTVSTATRTPVTTAAPAASADTRAQTVLDENKGIQGLVQTSLRGLLDFRNNLPPRKTLLGE